MKCDDCSLYARSEPVPLTVHDLDMARLERTNVRLFWTMISLIAALVISWVGFFFYESQFEIVEESKTQEVWQEADGNGNNSFVGGDNYGEPAYQDNDDETLP